MSSLIMAALRNRKVTLLATAVIVVYGFIAYYLIPKQENPDTSPPVAVITTIYPGASPTDVETLVTNKLEDELSQIEGFDHIRSYSRNSVSILILFLEMEADTEKGWAELRRRLNDVEDELPDQCRRPTVKTDLADTAGMIIALSGDRYSYNQLVDFAEEFKRELSRIPGIARFDIDGDVKKEVKVEVQYEKLNQYRVSLEDVLNLLKIQNVSIPSGYLQKDGVKINVSTPSTFESLEDIRNTIVDVSRETGAVVRLRDIADVHMGLERGVKRIRHNGENAVLLTGFFKQGENIVLVGRDVRRTLDRVKRRLPEELKVDEVLYQPEDVGKAVSGFMRNLLQGVVLVIVVVFLGMGLRNAIVVSTAIPISILATMATMYAVDIQIHMVSTAALIIALGMLVDNAIVIADAIQVRIDHGMPNVRAAFEGARDSAAPVFSATLTTVAAYVPLLMMPGAPGDFSRPLPLVVIISLSCSYLVAMFVTPSLASLLFRPLRPDQDARPGRLRRFFYFLLDTGMRHKGATIGITLALGLGAYYLQSLLGLSFFPHSDKPFAHIEIRSEISDIDRTDRLARQVEAFLATVPEITSYTTSVGEGLPKFYVTVGQASQSDDYAQIMFHFDLARGERFQTTEELGYFLQKNIDARLSGGKASVKILELADAAAAPIVLRVSGESLDRIREVADHIKAAIRKVPGTADISDDAAQESLEFRIDVDADVATHLGITKYDIQRQINIALYGATASVFRVAGKEYDIVVTSDIDTKEELENLAIKSRFANTRALLKQIATIRLQPVLENITHFRQERSVAVMSQVVPGYSAPDLASQIEREVLPTLDTDGVTVSFDGERERIIKNFGNVAIASAFAVVVVYLILFVQFNSFSQPMVILMTVPLSAVGSIVGLFLFQQPMSFMAILGMASLIGIVVNNAILLLDFINKARQKGYSVQDACVDSVSKRLRPIGLSTTTTVMGLTPMLLSGHPLFVPMSVSLMNGLIVSTLLTMVVIPVVFALVFGRKGEVSSADREEVD